MADLMSLPLFIIRASLLFIISLPLACQNKETSSGSISCVDAEKLIKQSGYFFLDVRTKKEHEIKHIPNTFNIPIKILEKKLDLLADQKDSKIIVYCRSGSRSLRATNILNQNGFKAFNMDGGIMSWTGKTSKGIQ